ncbi:hypothetical protein Rs2_48976 [Raphanus sativus]|nr:hypothetical protein Rs2_48976 [Raphanus sativus]
MRLPLKRGAKTVSSFAPVSSTFFNPYLSLSFRKSFQLIGSVPLREDVVDVTELYIAYLKKLCGKIQRVLIFLREVVSKVPDYGHAQGQGQGPGDVTMDDRTISKRRKPVGDEVNDSDEEYKKSKTQEMGNAKPSGRGGRGRGRGRGRGGRAARAAERENLNREMELESSMVEEKPPQDSTQVHESVSAPHEIEKKEGIAAASNEDTKQQQLQSPKEGNDFDLNAESLDLNETKPAPVAAATASEEYTCWSMELGQIDPAQFASLGKRIDEEEDYDEEEG